MQRIRSGIFVFVSAVIISTFHLFSNVLLTNAQPTSIPRVWSITADTHPTDALQRTFTVQFNEAVTGVDRTDFATAGDDQFARITGVNAIDDTSDTYQVVVAINGPSTQLALNLFDDDSILNATGVPLGGEGVSNGNAVSDVISINTTSQMQPQFDAMQPQVDAPASADHQVGQHTSIALTSTDIPIISYWDYTNSDLKLAVCNDEACANPAISTLDSTGIVGYATSIALTSTDIPVISYWDATNGDLKLAVCNNTSCTSPTISTIDSTGTVGEFTSIALTSANIPIIGYYDTTNSSLKLAVCHNAACTSPTISTLDSPGIVGQFTSIALTSTDIPIISYFDTTNSSLKLAVCNNAACTSPTISTLDSPDYVGYYTSIALTSTDIPIISYNDATNGNLELAVCNNTACTSPTISTIDSTGVVGQFTSIALTSADIPVISYYDTTNSSLKLAVCNNATCTSPTILALDATGVVGYYTSVALTSTDIPIVSYYDTTNGNLKLYHAPVIVDQGQPNSFDTLTPTANQRMSITTATLTWDASTYADSYEYCYATSIADCSTWVNTGTTTSASLTGLTHNTTYYWQVRAINTSGTQFADDDAYRSFSVVLPPTSFAKSAPTNTHVVTTTSTTLTWDASTYADSYEYCYATAITACTTWISTDTATSTTISDLVHDTTYYWQVRARNSGDTTSADDDAYYSFSVVLPPTSFAKSAPTNAHVVTTASTTHTWDASTYADSYEYCYATSAAACTTWISTDIATSATISGLVHDTIYYWQVRAINTSGTQFADDDAYHSFVVVLPPTSFAKSAPTDTHVITTTSTTLAWDDSTYADSYEYCYATAIATCNTWISTDTATSATINDLVHNTTYYWQVRAINTSGTQFADDDAYHSFSVVLPPTSFAKSTPTNTQSVTASSTTLTWASSTYASSYEYCIATSIAACTTWKSTGSTRSATITGLAHGSTYYWQVRARNSGSTTSADSDSYYRFTVTLLPVSFAKTAPANNATKQSTSVTLTWATSTYATSYEYCIALTTATCTTWKSTGTARTAIVTGLTKNKSYYWQVRAKNAGGTTLSATTYWKFTTAP
jgi:hypothetical protein